ncbi:GSCFA domain-containing protein [Patiriisocius hiemis]|uniref:GSCFA domain-containing protein n=1 Tax=Patiriisocius hiemis TaxID=3075604 RepID=A0ABU2YEG2_9FLAO|nr:GSCFA domain-containing protein [Constantimarinum sp. W242]MDT0556127.1 GSCFA domain-containing protein [Constantimarinum sp. W242]
MKLQTQIPLTPQENQIDYSSKVLLLGSCFTENIGTKFGYYKFDCLVNPFGIIFNPVSIKTLIERALQKKQFSEKDVFYHNEQWHCFEIHSKLSSDNKEKFISDLNAKLDLLLKYITEATHIIFTYGTSWVYNTKQDNTVVANCHKVPQKEFDKKILPVEVISNTITGVCNEIKKVNSKTNFIFTVSPVRHLKDGFIENTQSKAHLVVAIHNTLSPREQSRGLYYFPSFEIMLDELRDYRFYKQDMLHPNETAITIIWERFKNVWVASETETTLQEVATIQKGLSHKPFNEHSEAHKAFKKNLQIKIERLQAQFPKIKF